uniref:Bridging integrator 3 n=1 Tax=Rhipicephalus zambeziensis TaxID=60191 RepID=A0A224YKS0_9ACAR
MSWNPLKRLSKASSKGSPGAELDERTIEEFVSKFVRLERDTKKLHNDAKKYEDTMLALYHCEKKNEQRPGEWRTVPREPRAAPSRRRMARLCVIYGHGRR